MRGDDGPSIRRFHALALIELGHLVSAVNTLRVLLGSSDLPTVEKVEAEGLLGQALKKMYLNNVRSTAEAQILKGRFGPILQDAITHYGTVYDQSRPGDNYWHGINYAALLLRAQSDGVAPSFAADPQALCRKLAGAEPHIEERSRSDYPLVLAALGEAYFGLRKYERAARDVMECSPTWPMLFN